MKKLLIPFLVLPFALAACSDSTSKDGFGGYGEMSEESLSSGYSDSYLLAPAPQYYIGDPYKIEDVQYTPAEDMYYNNTGMAGIIPNDLNGTKTRNGEIFNSEQMVAASKTLPLPTIARVTNLDNGQSAVVRVNNRGPFVNSRIMDVSSAAAKKLGMTGQTKVQVQVIADQSAIVRDATLGAGLTSPAVSTPTTTDTAPLATTAGGTGPYTVQAGAFYAEDSATALAQRVSGMGVGTARVVSEGGMFKVQIQNLDATGARNAISTLRGQGMAHGLINNGRWVNADSI